MVRVAAANLSSTRVRLQQVEVTKSRGGDYSASELVLEDGEAVTHSPKTALRVISGRAHSGKEMGIMRSVKSRAGVRRDSETVNAIVECFKVTNRREYTALCKRFDAETAQIQENERKEVETRMLLPDNFFIHDRYSMVIFRVRDEAGHVVGDFDLTLTAGPNNDPNHLPKGFAIDRQANKRDGGTLTYYFN